MTKATQRERLMAGLVSMGYTPVACRSKKYLAYTDGSTRMLVGKSGALRTGRIDGTVADTIPVRDKARLAIMSVGDDAPRWSSVEQATAHFYFLNGASRS